MKSVEESIRSKLAMVDIRGRIIAKKKESHKRLI